MRLSEKQKSVLININLYFQDLNSFQFLSTNIYSRNEYRPRKPLFFRSIF